MLTRRAGIEDIQIINRILNHPSVYPNATLGRDVGALDIGPQMQAENLFGLMIDGGNGGCIILDPYDETQMEVHSCILPDFRGREAEKIAVEVMRFAFGELGTRKLLTMVQTNNKPADLFARQMGFVRISDGEEFRGYELSEYRWPCQDKELGALAVPEMLTCCPDPHFARICGAMTLRANSGFMGTGVALYNSHARLHGYPRMFVVDMDSILVGDWVVHFAERGNPKVETLTWQPEAQSPVSQ